MVLSRPIVELIYERGAFVPHDSVSTAAALMFYAPGLLGYSAVKIASPTFYSLRDARTPVLVSVGAVAVNLVLNLVLVRVMGYRGLALGTAIAAIFNAALLLALLSRRLDGLDARRIASSALRIGLATVVMGAVAWYSDAWLTDALPGTGFQARLLRVIASITAGIAALAAGARLLRVEELDAVLQTVRMRLAGRTGVSKPSKS
jgi:putative peptidoglycan lipid II flippase